MGMPGLDGKQQECLQAEDAMYTSQNNLGKLQLPTYGKRVRLRQQWL